MAQESKMDEKCKCGCGKNIDDVVDIDLDFEENEHCECNANCNCGDDCKCTPEHKCSEDSTCGEGCKCNDNCTCDNDCKCETECKCENTDYLKDLLRVQAEFDNYRKRMQSALGEARNDGFIEAIEKFLPALDSFKMATEYIQDKNTLVGIKFIEKGIIDTLNKMGVEEIDATGEFNPELHQAVDTDSSSDVKTNHIVKEVCKGFTYKGKVIRYSQVIVKR